MTDKIPGPGVIDATKQTAKNIIQFSTDIKSTPLYSFYNVYFDFSKAKWSPVLKIKMIWPITSGYYKNKINLDQFRIIEQNKCLSGDSLFFDFLRINGEIHSDGHRNEKDCHGFGGGGKHGGKPLGVHDPEIVLFIYAFMGWSAYFHS